MKTINASKWGTTVLIENDRILNYVNKRVLQLIGFKGAIHLFSEGKAALEFLQQHFRSLANHVEPLGNTVVFVDSDLPDIDAMDLLGVLDELDPATRERVIPVLMVPGHPCGDYCSCRKQRERLEVVSKPLIGSVLRKLIKCKVRRTLGSARRKLSSKQSGIQIKKEGTDNGVGEKSLTR